MNSLKYIETRDATLYGEKCKVSLEIRLGDECKNGICDFGVTHKARNLKNVIMSAGSCDEKIEAIFPEFKIFFDLHLCNHYGQPMYPVGNGLYWMKKDKSVALQYLRISEKEYDKLAVDLDDKSLFKYLLFVHGIIDRWKSQADEAIKKLEELTGEKWENPYAPEEERFTLKMDNDEKADIESKILNGCYTPEAIKKRKEEQKKAAIEKKKNEIVGYFDKKIGELEDKKRILLYVLDLGMDTENMIYYPHNKTVTFNWLDYKDKITQEEFVDFLDKVDYSQLPEGIQFTIK